MADDPEPSIVSPLAERIAKISHIGPWELGRFVGKGASGIVHLANHKATGQRVAIKIMSTEAIRNSRLSLTANSEEADKAVQNIEKEIVIMKLIEHPNVLSLLDVWEAKGLLFLIMEYIDGSEFFDYLAERGQLPVPEALHYFQQLMYGVAYCHQFHIAHRDLKLENILLDKEGNLKIADFGMAMFVPRDSLLYTSCGSPHYASPEVVNGVPYNGCTSDVWSCGVILFAMLAGKLPFDDDNLDGLLGKVREGKYTIPTDVPWPAQNLIRRMMQRDVERRITVSEILVHPFFRSVLPRSQPVLPPTFADLASAIPFDCGDGSIDGDILKNMRALWRNRQDNDIIRAIRNKNDNWEKIVHHLLSEFRMKRLRCIGPDEDGRTPQRRRRKSRQHTPRTRPGDTSGATGNTSVSTGSPLRAYERPSAPTPSRGRSQTVAADFSMTDISEVLNATAPLTPRKRTKTAPTSSESDLPEIVIQDATPGRKGLRVSVDSLEDYDNTNTRMFKYLDPRTCNGTSEVAKVEPFVPIGGPDMQEDVFFQQIAEMLVNMSKQDEHEGKSHGDSKLNNVRNPKELKVPASEVPPPPTTPSTPVFQNVDTFATPPQPVGPTIRVVQQPGVLTPSNVDKSTLSPRSKVPPTQSPRLLKDRVTPPKSILTKPTSAKENVPRMHTGSSTPSRGRARAMTLGTTSHQSSSDGKEPSKKRVHIVTPDPSVFVERTRRRSQSVSKEESRSSDNWFSNLFNFKSNRQELFSLHDVFSTRERCILALRALGAQVEAGEPLPQMYGGGTLRCRIEEIVDPSGTVAVSKALRFRVEIRPTTGVRYATGYLSELMLVQEKGQPSSFNALCDRLRRGWELDVTCQPDGSLDVLSVANDGALPSPALTAGGRYAEV